MNQLIEQNHRGILQTANWQHSIALCWTLDPLFTFYTLHFLCGLFLNAPFGPSKFRHLQGSLQFRYIAMVYHFFKNLSGTYCFFSMLRAEKVSNPKWSDGKMHRSYPNNKKLIRYCSLGKKNSRGNENLTLGTKKKTKNQKCRIRDKGWILLNPGETT